MLKRIYQRLFVLPPVEQRHMLEGRIRQIFYPYLRKEAEDTYIYYLVMKNSFFVASLFSFLYWASYTFQVRFDFVLFSIYVEQQDFVRSMIWSYPFIVSTFLIGIFAPYGWLLFRENIRLASYDLLRMYPSIAAVTGGSRNKLMKNYVAIFIMSLAVMYGSFGLPEMVIRYKEHAHLATSYSFFVILLCAYTVMYSAAMYLLVLSTAGFWQHWRRLGPRYPE